MCACRRTASPGAAALHLFVPPVPGCVSSLQRNAGFSWSLARLGDITCDLGGQWVKKLEHDMLAHGHEPFGLTPQWSSGGFLVWEGVSGMSPGVCRTWVRLGPCGLLHASLRGWSRGLDDVLPSRQGGYRARLLGGSSGLCPWRQCCIVEGHPASTPQGWSPGGPQRKK